MKPVNPLTPHIRGNARLRRKLDRERDRYEALKRLVGRVLVLADAHGLGDHRSVVAVGAAIGWVRMTAEERAEVAREIKEARA